MGFTNTLLEILKKENPTHIAVVFDTDAPTGRHTDFEAYKGHRQAMPEDLSIALPYVKKVIEGFNVPVLTSDGYEADDIIGTLAKQAEKEGFTVYCMTPDKDFAQLVSENIFVYKPSRMGNDIEIMGVPEVLAKWEIEHVHQVIDILGLWGDAVDNIPGIPGIGEKTAKLLIKQYGSMENIIANSHELKGKQRENVEAFAVQGILSKKLATIILDAPVTFHEESFRLEKPNRKALEPIFAELEFRTLGRRVFGDDFNVSESKPVNESGQMDLFGSPVIPAPKETKNSYQIPDVEGGKNINNVTHQYFLTQSTAEIQELIQELKSQESFCFDTETTGTDANCCELVGLSFSFKIGEGYYVPLPCNQTESEAIVHLFRDVLENERIDKTGQNLKYDIMVLKNYGVHVKGKLFDTMLAHYVIDPDSRHGMDIMAQNYLGYTPVSISELIGKKGKGQGNMRDVEVDVVKEYAVEDADITLQLKKVFEPMLVHAKAVKLVSEIENPLIYVLADIEREGVRIDIDQLSLYSKELEIEVKRLEKSVFEKAGVRFNLGSPKQLGEVLFDKLKLDDKAKKTKTGQYQTG